MVLCICVWVPQWQAGKETSSNIEDAAHSGATDVEDATKEFKVEPPPNMYFLKTFVQMCYKPYVVCLPCLCDTQIKARWLFWALEAAASE